MDVETVAARSYWHPNGYAKLVIADSPQGQTRLHVWTEIGDGGDIHDHAWDYQSTVLAGALREERYSQIESRLGRWMWRHDYERTGNLEWTLTDPIQVRLIRGIEHNLAAGDHQTGRPGTIHRFYAVQVPAVTLIRVGPVRGRSHVYRPGPELMTVAPRAISSADVTGLLDLATRLAPGLDLHTLDTT